MNIKLVSGGNIIISSDSLLSNLSFSQDCYSNISRWGFCHKKGVFTHEDNQDMTRIYKTFRLPEFLAHVRIFDVGEGSMSSGGEPAELFPPFTSSMPPLTSATQRRERIFQGPRRCCGTSIKAEEYQMGVEYTRLLYLIKERNV